MMKQQYMIAALLLSGINTFSYATVGGEQTLEFLGYELRDQKLYVLREYHDGRGRLPQLYYYHFKHNNTPKLIEVRSLYINPKTGQPDYDNNRAKFERELGKIKHRLIPLYPLDPNTLTLNIVHRKQTTAPAWYDDKERVKQYRYQYQVSTKNSHSGLHQSVSYSPELKIEQAYRIPWQNRVIVSVKYLGIPFETGYTVEDPVLLHGK